MPRFVLGLGVHSGPVVGAIASKLGIKFGTASARVAEKVFFLKPFLVHPVLVVLSVDTVPPVDQVGKPSGPMAGLGAPNIFGIERSIGSVVISPWEVKRMGIRIFCVRSVARADVVGAQVRALANFSARRRAGIVLIAAFLGCAVDLELIRNVQV